MPYVRILSVGPPLPSFFSSSSDCAPALPHNSRMPAADASQVLATNVLRSVVDVMRALPGYGPIRMWAFECTLAHPGRRLQARSRAWLRTAGLGPGAVAHAYCVRLDRAPTAGYAR